MERTAVIYNGLDLDRFAPFNGGGKVAGQRRDGRLVITVGRLVPQKNLDLFLEAARLVANKKAGVRFLIVGDGPCREPLERYASRIGLDGKVSFLGERADVPQLLQAADVFWLTSAWEGLPNVLLEAMACGKPVVTRDVGACREAVDHGVNGYLVPTRDSERFAEHTLTLLANPDRASEMGEAARKTVEKRFSVSGMVLATEKLYSSVLGVKAGISN
jgi:glycosyltransferase involved in cell wall biosynthesis